MTATAIEFPVIQFSQGMALAERSEEGLHTCSSTGLKNGWFDDLYIVDSACHGYPVREVRKVGTAGGFFGFSLTYGRRYRIELDLGPAEELSLDDVKARILKAMKRNREFWESGYSWDELKAKVKAADSVEAIVELMS